MNDAPRRRDISDAEGFGSALDALEVDVLHIGIFDLDATFRDRRVVRFSFPHQRFERARYLEVV